MKKDEQIFIAGYTRVSSKLQVTEGKSLDEQRKAIERYAAQNEFEIFKIYEDAGVSGRKAERPALDEMKKDAEKGNFQRVVFAFLDRFGRNALDTLNNFKYFEEKGLTLISLKEGIDTSTSVGRMTRTILAAMAEMESERIKERSAIGLYARAEKGLRIGMGPYAYFWNEDEERFEIDPETVKIYNRMVREYLVERKSQTQIAVDLNRDGIKSRMGKKWTQISVNVILTNPSYKGAFRCSFQDKEYEVPCPPLIDAKKWNRIQEIARENFRRSKNYNKDNDPFILRHLLRCGECKSGMHPDTVRNRDQVWRYYVCYVANMSPGKRNSTNVEKVCNLPSIPADKIETYVLYEIMKHFQFPGKLVAYWENQIDEKGKVDLQSKLKGQQIRLGKLEAKREEYWSLFNENDIDKQELAKREVSLRETINKMKAEIAEVENAISQIESKEEDLKRLTTAAKEIKKLGPRIQDAFGKMTNEQKKEFLREALDGETLTVKIKRKGDIVESTKGMTKEEIMEPLIDHERPGPKAYAWDVEGSWLFNIEAAARYLKPLVELQKGT